MPCELPCHLVITGPMGVGKTTTAAALADQLGWELHDSDRDIETLLGITGKDVAARHGVPALHRLEAAVLLGALAGPGRSVIAAAASVVDDPVCRLALSRRALVVVLGADPAALIDRAARGGHRRPMSEADHAELASRRDPHYRELADLEVEAERHPDELAATIVELVVAIEQELGAGSDGRSAGSRHLRSRGADARAARTSRDERNE